MHVPWTGWEEGPGKEMRGIWSTIYLFQIQDGVVYKQEIAVEGSLQKITVDLW